MAHNDFEVAVVGAGPTGLAAALYAQAAGLRTVLIDPHPGVIDKACGEGLMPGAVARLAALGVVPSPAQPFVGIRYRLASEAEWEHAARAGSQRRFWSGLVAPQAVDGVVPANPNGLTGLHDRFGERVADCWSAGLSGDVADGRAFAQAGCRTSVVKDFDATGARASAAARLSLGHDVRHPSVGLRVVREME